MSSDDRDNEEPTSLLTQLDDRDNQAHGPAEEWQSGQRLGPFILKKKLGSGGMGMVWLAEQLVPLRREVALKVLLPEKRSKLAEAQFEVERQALAQLSHRAIAQIHDAGELPDGGLFFAMEYVPGERLDHHLQSQPLSLKALIALMVEICAGMQHAHQHGLIHRDIKPANILVSEFEDRPYPKIIDFGVVVGNADGPLSSNERYYHAGTRAYMAPEQRQKQAAAIDVRTDVYGLGAVLAHCLLIHAGVRFEGEQGFLSTQAQEALNRSLGENTAERADDWPGIVDRLKKLPTELRAIACKAMAEAREDRYQSASALAEDLQRWLHAEPVRAMGDSRAYRLRCFLRRNALASAAAGLISLALVGGMITALYGLTEAREGRSQAESALQLAEQRRTEAEELIQFMLGDFAEQLRPIGRLDLLDSIGGEALRYLTAQGAGNDPRSALSRARALRTLGEVQVRRQQFDTASATLTQAAELLAPWCDTDNPELDELHFESGQIAFWRGAVTYRQRDWESTETHWLRYVHHARLFAELSDDYERGQRELGYANNNLGTLAEARGDLDKALQYLEKSIDVQRTLLIPDDIDTVLSLANSLSWQARVAAALGQAEDAWRIYQEVLNFTAPQQNQTSDDARRRSLEMNTRYILAYLAHQLQLHSLSLEHLRQALPLAKIEVENEPGQPQTQIQLARIAFMLARTPGAGSNETVHALERGKKAVEAAEALGLDPQLALELPALRELARLHQGMADNDNIERRLNDILQALDQRESFDSPFFNLVELVTETMKSHTTLDTALKQSWVQRLEARLDAIPDSQQQSLRYRLAQLAMWQLLDQSPPERRELEQSIDQTRRSIMQLASEGPSR